MKEVAPSAPAEQARTSKLRDKERSKRIEQEESRARREEYQLFKWGCRYAYPFDY